MAFIQQRVTISSFFSSLVNTKTFSLLHCATKMESDPVPEHFNKGYIEARALYYDDRLGEASEAA
jgi:hypothetical protein